MSHFHCSIFFMGSLSPSRLTSGTSSAIYSWWCPIMRWKTKYSQLCCLEWNWSNGHRIRFFTWPLATSKSDPLFQATLLNNIRIRYERNKIYTYVANILIAINPYYEVPKLYESACIRYYKAPESFSKIVIAWLQTSSLKHQGTVIVGSHAVMLFTILNTSLTANSVDTWHYTKPVTVVPK